MRWVSNFFRQATQAPDKPFLTRMRSRRVWKGVCFHYEWIYSHLEWIGKSLTFLRDTPNFEVLNMMTGARNVYSH